MKNKLIVINYDNSQNSTITKAARNYLVIPSGKRVYLVISKDMTIDTVFEICDGIIENESEDFAVYVYVRRDGDFRERLVEKYGAGSRVSPVVVGKMTEMYINAADIVLTKATLLKVPKEPGKGSKIKQFAAKAGTDIKCLTGDAKKLLDKLRAKKELN